MGNEAGTKVFFPNEESYAPLLPPDVSKENVVSQLQKNAVALQELAKKHPGDKAQLDTVVHYIKELAGKIQQDECKDFDFLGKAQTKLRKWGLRHPSTPNTATTAYLLTLGVLYTALWWGIYTGVSKGDPAAFFDTLAEEKAILAWFVLSMVVFVGLAHMLYVLDRHHKKTYNRVLSDKSAEAVEIFNDDSMNIIPAWFQRPFSTYPLCVNLINACDGVVGEYRKSLEFEDSKKTLADLLHAKMIELREMMNSHPYDSLRIKKAMALLENRFSKVFSKSPKEGIDPFISDLDLLMNEERQASIISRWLLWPTLQVAGFMAITAASIAIATAIKDDPQVFSDVLDSGGVIMGAGIIFLVMAYHFIRYAAGGTSPTFPTCMDRMDPFSDQKKYIRVLKECRDALECYTPTKNDSKTSLPPSSFDMPPIN